MYKVQCAYCNMHSAMCIIRYAQGSLHSAICLVQCVERNVNGAKHMCKEVIEDTEDFNQFKDLNSLFSAVD